MMKRIYRYMKVLKFKDGGFVFIVYKLRITLLFIILGEGGKIRI